MPIGRVKFFNTDRGYGFIAPDGGGSDVFVHVHEVEAAGMKMLVAGQLVAYEVGLARDGRSKALNLRLIRRPRCWRPSALTALTNGKLVNPRARAAARNFLHHDVVGDNP